MSLLEQNITKKGQIDKAISQLKFDEGNNDGIYKVEAIRDSRVYTQGSLKDHPLSLYYLVSWKNYLNVENT